ncbi:MAG: hypothetical protein KDE35_08770 [Geminicoccaceae bacterium]|nr:hypothetical protein [Geminicoccaceae bacterium]
MSSDKRKPSEDPVDEASEESFPASDPPAYSGGATSHAPGEPDSKKRRTDEPAGELDEVEEASEDSFPASDPPAYTTTKATPSQPRGKPKDRR